MKKTIFAAALLTGIMAVSFCACDSGANANDGFAQAGGSKTTVTGTENYAGLSSAQSVYAMGAVTTAGFIASENVSVSAPVSARSLSATASDRTAEEDQTTAKEEADEFNRYLGVIESFLDEEQLLTTVEENTDEAYADYDIKLTVTGKDIGGEDVLHVLYYTETYTRSSEKSKRDEIEVKTEYSLRGVMVLGGSEYAVRGERKEEEEREEDETETKNEIVIRAYPDENDYKTFVQMSYSTETEEEYGETEEERSYVYTVVENGALKERTVVKYETETKESETETKYSIAFYGAETGARSVYTVSRELDGNGREMLKVYYMINNGSADGGAEQGYYRVSKDADGNYVYTFRDGSEKRFGAHR